MPVVGKIESLWRYPVKSMRGEALDEAFVTFAGVYGDRLFAVKGSARPRGFPYLTGREHAGMLLYQPRFRHPARAAKPPNWVEAQDMGPGLTSIPADPADVAVDVETPTGEILAVDDPRLLQTLAAGLHQPEALTLLRSERSMTDCRPVSLFSLQTAHRLGEELHLQLDKRRFRANIVADLSSVGAFGEDHFVGRILRIGERVRIAVLQRDSRCAMISIDPGTAERNSAILGQVTRAHDGKAGVYGAVLAEGVARVGDEIEMEN